MFLEHKRNRQLTVGIRGLTLPVELAMYRIKIPMCNPETSPALSGYRMT
jgi:hypothetical protein